ncbi:MAG: poly-gamma-glutamate hydrolase family protein, partial [Nannocystaceae bacterium]
AAGFLERFGLNLPRTGVSISGIITTDDCPADGASLSNAFVECLDDDRLNTRFVVTAPHGGKIEEHTDEQAEYVRNTLRAEQEDVTLWTAKGWHQNGAKDHWHITSTEIGTRSFEKLDSIADRNFQYAVSFHGRGGFENQSIVWVGGGAPLALRQQMKQHIENNTMGVTVNLANQGNLAGTSPANFVNWLTLNGDGGIQLEQTADARELHGTDIAQGVVDAIKAFN